MTMPDPVPTTWDLIRVALAAVYPSTGTSLDDLIAAHFADNPAAWEADARQWYSDQGIDVTGKALEDVTREYWGGALSASTWASGLNIRVTTSGKPRMTSDFQLRKVT